MNTHDAVLQETLKPGVSIAGPRVRRGSRKFYVGLSAACLAIAVVGFMPTYWLQLAPGTFDGAPLVHLHAWLFSAWPLYFLMQALLAARGHIARHRAWGLLGVSLATAMVIVGIAVANSVLVTRLEDGSGDPARAFHIVSMSMMVLFAGFVAAALASVSRPEAHKRLMTLATISILPPATARLFFAVSVGIAPGLRPSGGPPRTVDSVLMSALVADLFILAAIAYDVRTRGRPHPVYVIGGTIVLAVQIVRGPLSTTEWWYAVADFLVSVVVKSPSLQ
jgi:hypothetical protein